MREVLLLLPLRFFGLALFLVLSHCQTPESLMVQRDENHLERQYAKIDSQDRLDLKRAVIVDVRSRFDFNLSRLPASINLPAQEWDLSQIPRNQLEKKASDLQRRLSLKGIEPLTQVVILGEGLKGQGEEFLVATSLVSLGLSRIHFMNTEEARNSFVVAHRDDEPVANVPRWQEPLGALFFCEDSKTEADLTLGASGVEPKDLFHKSLKIKKENFPKRLGLRVKSPGSYWAYGVALHLENEGQNPCVVLEDTVE